MRSLSSNTMLPCEKSSATSIVSIPPRIIPNSIILSKSYCFAKVIRPPSMCFRSSIGKECGVFGLGRTCSLMCARFPASITRLCLPLPKRNRLIRISSGTGWYILPIFASFRECSPSVNSDTRAATSALVISCFILGV